MLKIFLVFWKSEPQYAYERYAYKKHVCHLKKEKLLVRTFFESHFNIDYLIWMFCGRAANDKINRPHKMALRIIYDDFESTLTQEP